MMQLKTYTLIKWASLLLLPQLALSASTDQEPDTAAIKRDFPEAIEEQPTPLSIPPVDNANPLLSSEAPVAVTVKNIAFIGNTVFSEKRLQSEAAPFIGRVLDNSDIEELRYRLTRLYIEQGYINSGAALDGYDANTQQLRFRLVEGRIKDIQVHGLSQLRPSYVEKRLQLAAGPPFHLPTLQERFLLLIDDPLIESLHGDLAPSTTPGEAILKAEAHERRRYNLSLTLDNHGPVSIGENRALFSSTLRNITGWGESITLGYDQSEGNHRGRANLSIPVNARDTKLNFLFERSNSRVVEEPTNILDVKSNYQSYEIGVIHPLINSIKKSLILGWSISARSNKTGLLGRPFSFTPGSVDGKSTIAPARFTQEWSDRDVDRMYAVRSAISLGTPAFGASDIKIGNTDTKFLTWVLQQRYTRAWINNQFQIFGRLDMQFTDSPLPVLEQLGIGGIDTVRGYRENTLIRDQALLTSLEARYGLFNSENQARYGRLDGAIFTDAAYAWNKGDSSNAKNLWSVGIGLIWSLRDYLKMELYWGQRLKDPPEDTSGTLQDNGIHFQLRTNY